MVQERHLLSKAFKSELFFEMELKLVVTLNFIPFSLCWFKPVEVSFQKCVLMLYFFVKEVKWKK